MMRVELSSAGTTLELVEGEPRHVAYRVERLTGERLTEGHDVKVTVLHVDRSDCQECKTLTPDELLPAQTKTRTRLGREEHVVCAVCGLPK